MMRSVDVYAKTLGTPVRSILFSLFTSKQKSRSLSIPLHFPLQSSSYTPSRFFSNVVAVSNSPIRGIRNFGSLFTVRAISSSLSTTAPVAPAQPQPQQHQGECSETGASLEVDDGNNGGLEEEAKLSIPVRAYFFSTSVDLRSLIEQNRQNFIPPTSLMNWYYCFLAPLTLPALLVAVYFHWLRSVTSPNIAGVGLSSS